MINKYETNLFVSVKISFLNINKYIAYYYSYGLALLYNKTIFYK